ncbi:MAG: TonB family protein [Alphaproteobacteria bacterium]|nr:TonB family protein [Alphaproteobacteria bacterium]
MIVRSFAISALAAALLMTAHADPPAAATTEPTFRADTPLPAYPPRSRRHKEAGVVKLALCVDAAGKVTKADLAKSSGYPNLDKAVLTWIHSVTMNPAMRGATPVAVCDIPFSYEFKVTKGPDKLQTRTTNPFDVGPPSN